MKCRNSVTFLIDIEMIIEKYTAKKTSRPGPSAPAANDDEEDAGEEEDDFVDEEERFENSKRKLRMVLCQADFQNLPLLHPDNRVPDIK